MPSTLCFTEKNNVEHRYKLNERKINPAQLHLVRKATDVTN